MKINVTRDNVVIDKNSIKPHENEYNITQCHFTFDDFIDSFQVKRVIFTVESTGEMYENDILDYECEIPSEILEHEYETIKVGVYGYNIGENEELINRFSPSYDIFVVPTGSYKEGALSPEPITPSQYDIYSSKLQEGLDDVAVALEEVSHVDIDAEQLEDGASVTITDRNGEDKTVTIHDGEKGDTGEQGPQGVPGYTPKKGIDYFTTSEINDIENAVKEQVKTDLDFDNTIDGIESDIDDLQDTKANISDLAEVAFTGEFSDLKNIPSYATTQQLNQEIQDRQDADVNLQSQIDAISVSSDVVDVVGTYQELLDYDTTHLKDNDIVKVLQDSTHSDALSYYRWDKETSTWSYIGSEGPFYTKSETQGLLNAKEDKITTTNKLDADLVDDSNSTNKFVTEEDITYWDNKEDKSNKVTEINSSSTDTQYPSAKCVYESQTAQDTEIDTLKMIYNILPTDTDTGETISIDNTGEMPIKNIQLGGNTSQVVIPAETGTNVNATSISISDVNTDKEHTIELSGNTYQETTTGKNLAIFEQPDTTISGLTITYDNATGKISIKGKATSTTGVRVSKQMQTNIPSGTYTLSINSALPVLINYVVTDSQNNNTAFRMTAGSTSVTNTLSNNGVQASLFVSIENNVDYDLEFYMQLEQGSTATSFEKFTFGPSPNPSYPQNIEVVTGTQNVEVCGKNIFNPTYEVETQYDINGNVFSTNRYILNNDIISIDKSNNSYGNAFFNKIYLSTGTYTFSCNVSQANNTTSQARLKIQNWTNSSSIVASKSVNISSGKVEQTFEVSSNAEIGIMLIPNQNSDGTLYLSSIQLEENSTATTYEAYTGITYPVNLGNIELCKISTYQDRIYKKNDKWYLEKKTGKIVLNGSETDWESGQAYGINYYRKPITNLLVSQNNNESPLLISNYYTGYSASTIGYTTEDYAIYRRTYHSQILMRNKDAEYLQTLKTWLSTHNTIVYYPLATPTTTEITDSTLVSQLNALYNSTLYSTTNINTTTSNLLPYIDLHYNFVTPSPSPSRPSVVNVVKGNNTITISNSDNTESQTYQVNLPSGLELCKISTYQDYFYKDNGNWYKHSEIGKVVLNGSEEWNIKTTLTNTILFQSSTDMIWVPNVNVDYLKSNYFIDKKWIDSIYANLDEEYMSQVVITTNNFALCLSIDKDKLSSENVNGFKTWLSTHNTTVYYPLSTPTDTQITDTALITQLDNLQKAISYDSQTNISQTNEDKPFIITAEMFLSLKNVLN